MFNNLFQPLQHIQILLLRKLLNLLRRRNSLYFLAFTIVSQHDKHQHIQNGIFKQKPDLREIRLFLSVVLKLIKNPPH